jgi:azurin
LVFNNVSGIFRHNWVIVQAGQKDAVAGRGTTAGPGNGWLQPEDPDVIASVGLLDPGETGEVRFFAPPTGTYQFLCTFPGHTTMYGDFVVNP